MKYSLKLMAGAWLASALASVAQETNGWGRVSLSYRAALNISASFSGLGRFGSFGDPGPAGRLNGAPGAVVRAYDDGFIGIDISGNAGDATTFWGYEDQASQWVGDSIHMHSVSSAGSVSAGKISDDPQSGIEISGVYPLMSRSRWSLGMEAGLGWTDISIHDSRTMAGSMVSLTHSFALGGVIPPATPPSYAGTVEGPGALLSDTAEVVSGGTISRTSTSKGTRKIEGGLYTLRIGPNVDFKLIRTLSFSLGGGLSLGLMDNEFSFNETVDVSGLGSQSRAGRIKGLDWLYGGYVRGQVNVRLCRATSIFAGVELNHLGTVEQTIEGVTAQLDLRRAIFICGGLSFSF